MFSAMTPYCQLTCQTATWCLSQIIT